MRKIAVGDLGEFWYGDYKEPFEQLEGAVTGHPVGVVLKDDAGKVMCAYCGKTFDRLAPHLKQHGMTSAQYKSEVGLLRGAALVSERVRVRAVRHGVASTSIGKPVATSLIAAGDSHYGGSSWRRTPEHENKTGRCHAQLLAVGRTIQARDGVVTLRALKSHGVGRDVVELRFGSMDNFRHLVGDKRPKNKLWTTDQLREGLRALGKQLGRTPMASDLRRYGLPSSKTYGARFGSYVAACEAAGLSPRRFVPTPHSDAAVLLAYATTGSTERAGQIVGREYATVRSVLARYGIDVVRGGGGDVDRARRAGRRFAEEIAARLEGVAEPQTAA